ncbi:unnamed protein product [marine sediment metagenome]|uniref:Uncharacterized protein n=1 Tax=marine sediment metagenome TaxID=412755 RepID=X1PJJ5_9ZZZZ
MKQMCVGKPVIVGEITIVPLEGVNVYQHSTRDGFSVYVSREPVGFVIGSPQGKQAVDIYGEQVPLETYIQEVDGLQQVLDSL